MATWRIHNHIAMICKDLLKVKNVDEYLLGAVYPDLPKVYDRSNDKLRRLSKRLHYEIMVNDEERISACDLPDFVTFCVEHFKEIEESDFMKGWFTHIIVDFVFDKFINGKAKYVDSSWNILCEDGVDREYTYHELASAKHTDMKSFSNNLNIHCICAGSIDFAKLANVDSSVMCVITDSVDMCKRYTAYLNVSKFKNVPLIMHTVKDFNNLIKESVHVITDVYNTLWN